MAAARKGALAPGDVRSAALVKLEESGLDAKDMKVLRMEGLTAKEVKAVGLPEYMALKLPYFDLKGRPTSFYRLRYLEDTLAENPFAAQTNAKTLRYIQPPDTLNEVYLPPLLNWLDVAKNPETSLVITEGELKSAAACKLGIPCMGLGGVWCFKSVKRKLPLLPMFHEFKWKGRTVYLCYDSDAATNPLVVGALVSLARELLALGAVPKVVTLPELKGLTKTGLDDFLVAKGVKPFATLLQKAQSFAVGAALYELNAEVAYIRNPGMVVVLTDGLKMTPGAFKEHGYANRYYHEEKVTEDGVKMVKKPVAPAWLGWEQRSELACLTYAPGQSQITADKAYNSWPGWGVQPKRGSVAQWTKLLDHVMNGAEPAARKWIEQWLAYPLQNPGTKLYTACVIWGVHQGTGKSLIGYTMSRIYGSNFIEIGDEELGDARREWAQNKQFVMGDDVTSGENKRHIADRLKSMITQLNIRIDPKYVPSFTLPDVINYYFTSQHPDAFFVEDLDRRYFVHEVTVEPLAREWYKDYVSWCLKGPESEMGAAAVFEHLLRLDLKGFDPAAPALGTAAKKQMVMDGLSDMGLWVRRLREEPDVMLRFGAAALEGDLWTNEELLRIADPENKTKMTANGLGRELKRAGFRQVNNGVPVRTEQGLRRLYSIRNEQRWWRATPKAVGDHYDDTRGEPGHGNGGRKF